MLKIKIVYRLTTRYYQRTVVKKQFGKIVRIDPAKLSPEARAIAEACAVAGVTRWHDRASIWGRSARPKGANWTPKQREVWGHSMANERARQNILLPLWDRRTNRYKYFEDCAKLPVILSIDPSTIESPPEVFPGMFLKI